MEKSKLIVRFASLSCLLIGSAYGRTYTSLGFRVSNACKGIVSLNKTVNCVRCSSMCHTLLQSTNSLDPQCKVLQIDSSDTQCTQAKAENEQLVCFDIKMQDTDHHSNIINEGRIHSIETYPYIGGHSDDLIKFVPLIRTDPPLPEYTHPSTPFETKGPSLSVPFNNGMMVCQPYFSVCSHWSYSSNTWTPMPLPRKKIQGRGLSVLNGRPIVIGGIDTASTETDSVEIFDPVSNQWIDGPKLTQARAFQSHVQVNDVTIIILGGYFKKEIAMTSLLSAGDTQWTELPDRPQAVTLSLSGMVQLGDGRRGILSIAGTAGGQYVKTAYFFDLALLTWTKMQAFEAPLKTMWGFIYQWESMIYFIPKSVQYGAGDVLTYEKNITEVDKPWKASTRIFQGLSPMQHLSVLNVHVFNLTTN